MRQLLVITSCVLLLACPPNPPALPDAAVPDGGSAVDGGAHPDSGTGDAGSGDAGASDAGASPEVPDLLPESLNFPLAVASGDVLPNRAVLWTRYDGTASLTVRVWHLVQGASMPQLEFSVTREDGGFVHVDVEGLEAGERYRFAFLEHEAGGVVRRSAIGRFRTAIAAGEKQLITIGATSCAEQGETPSTLARAGERTDLDLFLLLGDTSYNDNPPAAKTLPQFRTKWAANQASPEFRKLMTSTSVLATWDDHEVENDFNPETIDQTLLATARASFFESIPLRRDANVPDRIWKSFKWGDSVEIFVLDSRSERKPSTASVRDPLNTKPDQYLSPTQMAWFKAGLKASTAVFKVIMNSVPITDFKVLAVTGDTWLAYAEQRTEILSWIDAEKIPGVVWVAGDHHFGSAGTVSSSGAGTTAIEFLAGPAATADPNPLWRTFLPPRWDFTTGDNNFLVLQLNPSTRTFRASFHDAMGRELMARDYTPK